MSNTHGWSDKGTKYRLSGANVKNGRIAITAANLADLPGNLAALVREFGKAHGAKKFAKSVRTRGQHEFTASQNGAEWLAYSITDNGAVWAWVDGGAAVGANTRGCVYVSVVQFTK